MDTNMAYKPPKPKHKRTAALRKILTKLGGKYGGRNIDNYTRIAKITYSTPSTVKTWLNEARIIPQLKLDLLKKELL